MSSTTDEWSRNDKMERVTSLTVEKIGIRTAITDDPERYLKMSPWSAMEEYRLEEVSPEYFKQNLFVTGKAQEKIEELHRLLRTKPLVQVHGYRGTGKSTFIKCVVESAEFLDCEPTDSADDPETGPSSEVRLRRMFRSWLVRRLSRVSGDDDKGGVWTTGVLQTLDRWVSDSSWTWNGLDDNSGMVRKLVCQWADMSRSSTGHKVLTRKQVEGSLAGVSAKNLCIACVIVFAAVAQRRSERRTMVTFDNLDQLASFPLVEDLVKAAHIARNTLVGTRNDPRMQWQNAAAKLRLIFVTRTRTFRKMQNTWGDYRPPELSMNDVFNPTDVLQQRVKHMENLRMGDWRDP